ncbi:hypothetical protein CN296_27200 [Bacillus cereus]|nr:hypothetical protein CN296_27200 [Bacillus cereus]
MSDVYNNYGNAGAIGKNATSINTQINGSINNKVFSKNDIDTLQRLINEVLKINETNLPKSQQFVGVGYLSGIIESVKSNEVEKQSQHLSEWIRWVKGLKEPSLKALSIAADIVTIGLPLLGILGLSAI